MSAKRDRINNEMVIPFYHDERMINGNVYRSTAYDTMLTRRTLLEEVLIVLVVKNWGGGGRLVVRIRIQ